MFVSFNVCLFQFQVSFKLGSSSELAYVCLVAVEIVHVSQMSPQETMQFRTCICLMSGSRSDFVCVSCHDAVQILHVSQAMMQSRTCMCVKP